MKDKRTIISFTLKLIKRLFLRNLLNESVKVGGETNFGVAPMALTTTLLWLKAFLLRYTHALKGMESLHSLSPSLFLSVTPSIAHQWPTHAHTLFYPPSYAHTFSSTTHTRTLSSSSPSPTKIISIQGGPSSFPLFRMTSPGPFCSVCPSLIFPLCLSLLFFIDSNWGHGKGDFRSSGRSGFPRQDRRNFLAGARFVIFSFVAAGARFLLLPPHPSPNVIFSVFVWHLFGSLNLFRLHQKPSAALPINWNQSPEIDFELFESNKTWGGGIKKDFIAPPQPFSDLLSSAKFRNSDKNRSTSRRGRFRRFNR